jgi:hypothetical protein
VNSWDRLKTSNDVLRGLLSKLTPSFQFWITSTPLAGYRSNDIGDDFHNFSSTMEKQSKIKETNDSYGKVPTL